MRKSDMTPQDVTELCEAGLEAWRTGQRRFKWRGKVYVPRHTVFRLYIDDVKGRPVACRYD